MVKGRRGMGGLPSNTIGGIGDAFLHLLLGGFGGVGSELFLGLCIPLAWWVPDGRRDEGDGLVEKSLRPASAMLKM